MTFLRQSAVRDPARLGRTFLLCMSFYLLPIFSQFTRHFQIAIGCLFILPNIVSSEYSNSSLYSPMTKRSIYSCSRGDTFISFLRYSFTSLLYLSGSECIFFLPCQYREQIPTNFVKTDVVHSRGVKGGVSSFRRNRCIEDDCFPKQIPLVLERILHHQIMENVQVSCSGTANQRICLCGKDLYRIDRKKLSGGYLN